MTEESTVSEVNLDFNLSDDDVIDAANIQGFASIGDTTISQDESYLEFDTVNLIKRLLPFKQKKAAGKDIITRSLLIQNSGNFVTLRATDGISYLSANLEVKSNKFPETCLIDTESLYTIARSHSKISYLVYRDQRFYSNFYGGYLFVPSYSMDPKIFIKNHGKILSSGVLNSRLLLEDIHSFTPVMGCSEIPELGYIFICTDGVFASNGVIVSKSKNIFPPFVIRQSDISLISYMLEIIKDESVILNEYESAYEISGQSFSYVFPKITNSLSSGYKDSFVEASGSYFVNLPYLSSVAAVLGTMPESSGVIGFNFHKTGIDGIAKTRKGDTSVFKIANAANGSPFVGEITISLKALSVALRVFKGDASVSLSFQDERVILATEQKKCVILLKK